MWDKINKSNYLLYSIVFTVLLYILCGIQFYELVDSPLLKKVVQKHILTNNENSFVEIISAILWSLASLAFIINLVKDRSRRRNITSLWYIFFILICLAALGEEISWGQHYFDYSAIESLKKISSQGEQNIHNLNLAKLLGISKNHKYYYYLGNLGHLLNPIFYLVLSLLWIVLPFLKNRKWILKTEFFLAMPSPSTGLMLFFSIHWILFVFIDQFLFNVGQIFELFIPMVACIVAIDTSKQEQSKPHTADA